MENTAGTQQGNGAWADEQRTSQNSLEMAVKQFRDDKEILFEETRIYWQAVTLLCNIYTLTAESCDKSMINTAVREIDGIWGLYFCSQDFSVGTKILSP